MIRLTLHHEPTHHRIKPDRDGATIQETIFAFIDQSLELGDIAVAILRRRNGDVVAWVEAVAGPAPQDAPPSAITRGARIHAARDDWEEHPEHQGRRRLKAGRKRLIPRPDPPVPDP